MSDTPYRKQEDRPVCADCKHRRDANMMDEDNPWLDWLCNVTIGHEREAEYNPITGITTPGKTYVKRCREVNKGECAKFERVTKPSEPEPASEPTPTETKPRRRWRIFR